MENEGKRETEKDRKIEREKIRLLSSLKVVLE
jgi:hypothetical protein